MEEKKIEKSRKKTFTGIVTRLCSAKTIKIDVAMVRYHALYKKRIKLNRSFMVHDEKNEAKAGDRVLVVESRPLSKLKRWRLDKIIERAK